MTLGGVGTDILTLEFADDCTVTSTVELATTIFGTATSVIVWDDYHAPAMTAAYRIDVD